MLRCEKFSNQPVLVLNHSTIKSILSFAELAKTISKENIKINYVYNTIVCF